MTPEIEEELEKIGLKQAIANTSNEPTYVQNLLRKFEPSGSWNPRDKTHRQEMIGELSAIRDHAQGLKESLRGLDRNRKETIDLHLTDFPDRDDGIPRHLGELDTKLRDLIYCLEHEMEMTSLSAGEVVTDRGGRPKQDHAYDVAKAMYEIDYLANHKIRGAGNNGGDPSGPLGRQVFAVFKLLGIEIGWEQPAKAARDSLKESCAHLDNILKGDSLSSRLFQLSHLFK